MLNERQSAMEGKLKVQDRANERLQDQTIEEMKKLESTKTEEALQKTEKENDLWMCQNEEEEAKRLKGVKKLRQDEEIAWAPPRNMTQWPDWEEARNLENGECRLEPEGKRNAGNRCRFGCGGRHSCGPGWRKPSRTG